MSAGMAPASRLRQRRGPARRAIRGWMPRRECDLAVLPKLVCVVQDRWVDARADEGDAMADERRTGAGPGRLRVRWLVAAPRRRRLLFLRRRPRGAHAAGPRRPRPGAGR